MAELSPFLYTHDQPEAIRHAFRVASGLDSMVVGEPQILGQMKDAVRAAEESGTLGTQLHKLFQRSFSVAKEVRSTTAIGANIVSMAAAGVHLAERIFESIEGQRILFIGAGEMIELCAAHFCARQPKQVTIANRTLERGRALAERFNGTAIRLDELGEHLAAHDIVVSCTASPLPIIGLGMVERAIKIRRHRPIFMVDLAVPRDIEEEVGALDDIFLYTVDDLAQVVESGLESRQAAVVEAEDIIASRVQDFLGWLQARDTVPVIRSLRDSAERMRPARDGACDQAAGQGRVGRAGARAAVATADQQVSACADPGAEPGRRRRARRTSVSRQPALPPAFERLSRAAGGAPAPAGCGRCAWLPARHGRPLRSGWPPSCNPAGRQRRN